MIQANELRLFNLFNTVASGHSGMIRIPQSTVFKVIAIGLFQVQCVRQEQNPSQFEEWLTFDLNDICVIPVTPAWLGRMGFKKVNEHGEKLFRCGKVLVNTKMMLRYSDTDDDWYYTTTIVVHHVHQLQNLFFALTGSELTIKDK